MGGVNPSSRAHRLSIARAVFTGSLVLVVCASLPADDRTEPIDIVIAVDKSLSMEEEIAAVRQYVLKDVLEELLIPGDYLYLLAFYGQTEVVVSTIIAGTTTRSQAATAVAALRADGAYTDIGNALDIVKGQLDILVNNGRHKYVLLITDGRQEAPPESRYFSPEGTFNHEFLENARVIQRTGWKIHVIGIGVGSAAQQLAQELGTTYDEVPEQTTREEIAASAAELLGRLAVQGQPTLTPASPSGTALLRLEVGSSGYDRSVDSTLARVLLETADGIVRTVATGAALTVDPRSTVSVEIPVEIGVMAPGEHAAVLVLEPGGGQPLVPSRFDIAFRVRPWWEQNAWLAAPALVLLAALAFGVTRLARSMVRRKVTFKVEVQDQQATQDTFTVKEGAALYLNAGDGSIWIEAKQSRRAVARLSAEGGSLHITVLDDARFPDGAPQAGTPFVVRAEGGSDTSVTLRQIGSDG